MCNTNFLDLYRYLLLYCYLLLELNQYFQWKIDFKSTASTDSAKQVDWLNVLNKQKILNAKNRIWTYVRIFLIDLQSITFNRSVIFAKVFFFLYLIVNFEVFISYGTWTHVFAVKRQCPNRLDEKNSCLLYIYVCNM